MAVRGKARLNGNFERIMSQMKKVEPSKIVPSKRGGLVKMSISSLGKFFKSIEPSWLTPSFKNIWLRAKIIV